MVSLKIPTACGPLDILTIFLAILLNGVHLNPIPFDTKPYYILFFSFTGILCGPILLFWTFIRGDLEMAMSFPDFSSPGFLVFYGY